MSAGLSTAVAASAASPSRSSDLLHSTNSNNANRTPSPAVLRMDPQKERKLEERFSRAPGSRSQVGFDNAAAGGDTTTSFPGHSWEEISRGRESSRSRPSELPVPPPAAMAKETSNPSTMMKETTSSPASKTKQGINGHSRSLVDYFGGDRSNSRKESSSKRSRSEEEEEESPRKIEKENSEETTLRIQGGEEDGDYDDGADDLQGGLPTSSSPGKQPQNKKGRFTPEEDECLLQKQQEYGSNWKLVSQYGGDVLSGRTPNALSRRFTTLTKKTPSTTKSATAAAPSAAMIEQEEDDEVQIVEAALPASSSSSSASQPQIIQFFRPSNGGSSAPLPVAFKPLAPQISSTSNVQPQLKRPRPVSPGALSTLTLQHQTEIQKITLDLEKARRERHEAENSLESKTREFERNQEEMRLRSSRASELIQTMLRTADKAEAARLRRQCSEASFSLGRLTIVRNGVGPHAHPREIWEDGHMKKDLQVRGDQILQNKSELERQQKQSRTTKRRNGQNQMDVDLEERALEEVRTLRLAKLRQEEAQLAEDRGKYQVEKQLHIRELKRLRDEDSSKYAERPVLVNRYLLRSMLGKGGFSEVWKAFDLMEMRDVAIKVHELDPSWSEERRRNYSKHAKREYQIHLAVKHPRIVQLYDVIEINQSSSFATVLEYCPGTDLDVHLKKNKCLPEKEAKSILMQILSALLCLGSGGGVKDSSSIIHYDIKPANILFDAEGGVKITDFGLSKIVSGAHQDDTVPGVELTSQGAGTYWYLPPECFNFDRTNPPKISNKVDVWSTGVVFFQMLFGQRPFGEGMSQETMLKSETVLRATKVEFPAKPVVSDAAKDFIRRCLTHSQQLRPDVETLCLDPYLKSVKKKAPPPHAGATSSSSGGLMMAID